MNQLRLIIAEWLLDVAWRLMPENSEEKTIMAELLVIYSDRIIETALINKR